MGILKISDQLHEEIRKASDVMSRSINAQAEFWVKMGMYAESNPEMTFNQLIQQMLKRENLLAASAFSNEKPKKKGQKKAALAS